MKKALIMGITGQDGSYLWVAEGREVIRQGVREAYSLRYVDRLSGETARCSGVSAVAAEGS